jgi:hypothetical protein
VTAPGRGSRCRICGGGLRLRFEAAVLGGRYRARYCECLDCRALQVPDPTWLSEAYRGESDPPPPFSDAGRFRRNLSAYRYVRALAAAGAVPARPRILDFGGGFGLLAQMLVDGGVDAWTYDEHVPRPFFAVERALSGASALEESAFDLIVALEVLEHLVQPMSTASLWRRALRSGGAVVASTEIYRPGERGPDWTYLALEFGQHVTFWSEAALARLAVALDLESIGLFPGRDGFLVILSPLSEAEIAGRLSQASRLLADDGFVASAERPWDFRSDGVVQEALPLVRPVRTTA